MTNLNINLNQIDLTNFEVTWTPNQPEDKVTGPGKSPGNYGTVLNVVFEQNRISITTDKGKLVLSGPDLEDPGQGTDQNTIGNLINRLPTAGQMTDLYSVLMLMHEVAKVGRRAMRELAKSQAESVYQLNMKAAQDIRAAAALAFVGALVSGICSIASGLISLKQAGSMIKMSSNIQTKGPDGGDLTPEQILKNKTLDGQILALQTRAQGQAAMLQGVGNMGKGLFDYVAQEFSAQQKEKEALAAQTESLRQQSKEDQENYTKLLDSVREALQEINRSYEQSLKQIWS